jgi:hypothetical protein
MSFRYRVSGMAIISELNFITEKSKINSPAFMAEIKISASFPASMPPRDWKG